MNHQTLLCFSIGSLFVLTACDDSSDTTSPNSSYDLIFEGYLQSTAELLLLDSDLHTVRQLLPLETTVMDPTPSPNGTRIAFVVADYTQWTGGIYVINRDGSDLQRLTSTPQLDDQPAWSPDGTPDSVPEQWWRRLRYLPCCRRGRYSTTHHAGRRATLTHLDTRGSLYRFR